MLLGPTSESCERAGEAEGVGSYVCQPMPGKYASTQEWASSSRTMYSLRLVSKRPGLKPDATRAGTPPIRSISAITPENCWQ